MSEAAPIYKNAKQSIDARVEHRLARMTFDEKLPPLGCAWSTQLVDDGDLSPTLGL